MFVTKKAKNIFNEIDKLIDTIEKEDSFYIDLNNEQLFNIVMQYLKTNYELGQNNETLSWNLLRLGFIFSKQQKQHDKFLIQMFINYVTYYKNKNVEIDFLKLKALIIFINKKINLFLLFREKQDILKSLMTNYKTKQGEVSNHIIYHIFKNIYLYEFNKEANCEDAFRDRLNYDKDVFSTNTIYHVTVNNIFDITFEIKILVAKIDTELFKKANQHHYPYSEDFKRKLRNRLAYIHQKAIHELFNKIGYNEDFQYNMDRNSDIYLVIKKSFPMSIDIYDEINNFKSLFENGHQINLNIKKEVSKDIQELIEKVKNLNNQEFIKWHEQDKEVRYKMNNKDGKERNKENILQELKNEIHFSMQAIIESIVPYQPSYYK